MHHCLVNAPLLNKCSRPSKVHRSVVVELRVHVVQNLTVVLQQSRAVELERGRDEAVLGREGLSGDVHSLDQLDAIKLRVGRGGGVCISPLFFACTVGVEFAWGKVQSRWYFYLCTSAQDHVL